MQPPLRSSRALRAPSSLGTSIAFAVALVTTALPSSCARPARPFDYTFAAAQRAFTAGRMAEAAEAYERASREARRDIDRDEALYRAARAWMRAGQRERALVHLEWLGEHGVPWGRDARGAFEAARLRIEIGPREEGERRLEQMILRFIDSGPARRAVDLYLMQLDERDPTGAAAIAWLERMTPIVENSQLRAAVRREHARRLDLAGRTAESIAAYERLLTQTYPRNQHFDDGTLELARILVREHRAAEAIARIDQTLAFHEAPSMPPGSYTRPQFPRLAMYRAEIYRDELRDDARAAAAFREILSLFPNSLLRDNALFAEAEARERLGQHDRACGIFEQIARDFPCTRFGRRSRETAAGACGRAVDDRWAASCHRATPRR